MHRFEIGCFVYSGRRRCEGLDSTFEFEFYIAIIGPELVFVFHKVRRILQYFFDAFLSQ